MPDFTTKLSPVTTQEVCETLVAAAQFVTGVAQTFADWTRLFRQTPNQFPAIDQAMFQKGGGAKDIYYAHAYWQLAPDEAWVIDVTPPDCYYWNFQLDNWWMESLDYRFRQITVNKHSARTAPDGSVRIVCAARAPGGKAANANWIDTCDHREGTALLPGCGACGRLRRPGSAAWFRSCWPIGQSPGPQGSPGFAAATTGGA